MRDKGREQPGMRDKRKEQPRTRDEGAARGYSDTVLN